MALGIFRTRELGYFAPSANAPHIDLGPGVPPEARLAADRGTAAFLAYANRPHDPFNFDPHDPNLVRYQQAAQEVQWLDPSAAYEFAADTATIGIMADARLARDAHLSRSAALRGLGQGYSLIPGLPPGASFYDAAWEGMPW